MALPSLAYGRAGRTPRHGARRHQPPAGTFVVRPTKPDPATPPLASHPACPLRAGEGRDGQPPPPAATDTDTHQASAADQGRAAGRSHWSTRRPPSYYAAPPNHPPRPSTAVSWRLGPPPGHPTGRRLAGPGQDPPSAAAPVNSTRTPSRGTPPFTDPAVERGPRCFAPGSFHTYLPPIGPPGAGHRRRSSAGATTLLPVPGPTCLEAASPSNFPLVNPGVARR